MGPSEIAVLIFMPPWILGMIPAMIVQFRKVNARIRARVALTGSAVTGEYAIGLLVWGWIKAVVWPVTLLVWMTVGRPGRTTARAA